MSGNHENGKLDNCGCCASGVDEPSRGNLPGQPSLRYRAGTHPTFLGRMLARIYAWEIPEGDHAGKRPLATLTTRAADDPAIALMDAGAVVADVLTFYQERICNEGYLRTATERRSVLELARSIGYELDPGVAAATWVAFTVDEAEGAPAEATVPEGTQIQSVPAEQGELPQTFETAEDLLARARWNALKPLSRVRQHLTASSPRVYLEGAGLGIAAGDLVLLVLSGTPTPRRVRRVEEQTEHDRTRLDLVTDPAAEKQVAQLTAPVKTLDPKVSRGSIGKKLVLTPDNIKAHVLDRTWTEDDLQAFLAIHGWTHRTVLAYVDELARDELEDKTSQVYALGQKLAFFGHNAPLYLSLPAKDEDGAEPSETMRMMARRDAGPIEEKAETEPLKPQRILDYEEDGKVWPYNWDRRNLSIWTDSMTNATYADGSDVYLERPVEGLAAGTWAVFERPVNTYASYKIAAVVEGSRTGFGMSTKVTGLDLTDAKGNPLNSESTGFSFRTSVAHVKSEPLKSAAEPVEGDLTKGRKEIPLDTMVLGLKKGQAVALTGVRVGTHDQWCNEIPTLREVTHTAGRTELKLVDGLAHSYRRETVKINANVVAVSHGETVPREVLGSGDGSEPHQRFELKKPPLTHVSAGNASGSESSLSVRVDGVEWEQAPSLYALGETSRGYIVRIDNEARASVIFGDGKRGARLPTGEENVAAGYRTGIGSEGEVGAGSLSLLKTRPPGIREVTNPLAASGADDPEVLDEARTNAPLTVLTLDRIVSLQDYEDYARAYPGIGKAQATEVWDGEKEVVHVTVADADGDPVVPPQYDYLLAAIESARDPLREVRLATYELRVFNVEGSVRIDEAYEWPAMHARIDEALRGDFGFDRRAFGQPVTAAELVHVIHAVEGVVAVDLDGLYEARVARTAGESKFRAVLGAERARYDKSGNEILPAQLLLIHEPGIKLEEMAP